MKEEPVDPRVDKLVASLYNELSEEEERQLAQELEHDEALRAEWEELRSTRKMLGTWEVEETVPSFVMVTPEARQRSGFWSRVRDNWRGLTAVSGWAAAAAAILVMVLALKGLHVEKLDNGWAFRFGAAEPLSPHNLVQAPAGNEAAPPTPETRNVATIPNRDGSVPETSSPDATPFIQTVSSDAPFVTQQEHERYSAEMLQMMVTLLNDYRNRRDHELTAMLQALYGDLNDRQYTDYRELRGRIEAVGLGLRAEQSKTKAILDNIVDPEKLGRTEPDGAPADREENEND